MSFTGEHTVCTGVVIVSTSVSMVASCEMANYVQKLWSIICEQK